MLIRERKMKGVFEIHFKAVEDHRGFFMRVYDEKIFREKGIEKDWVQENHALSIHRGTIRGLHFQFPPHAETKLVRAVGGEIFDVFVDLRKDSPTFGNWDSIILPEENRTAVYIPKGFAHGYCSLTDRVHVIYRVDAAYAPEHEETLRWNDPDLGIVWPIHPPIFSGKDNNAKSFKDFVRDHRGMEIQNGVSESPAQAGLNNRRHGVYRFSCCRQVG